MNVNRGSRVAGASAKLTLPHLTQLAWRAMKRGGVPRDLRGQMLLVLADEKQREGSRAGMGTNNGVDVVHHEFRATEAFRDFRFQCFDIFNAVAMRDEDGLACGVDRGLLHMVDEGFDRFASPANLFHRNEAPLIVDVQHGFDVEQSAGPCACAAHSAAAEQKHEVVDRKPMAQVVARVAHELGDLFHARPVRLFLASKVDEHAFATRGGIRFDGDKAAFGVFVRELLHQKIGRLECSRKRARKAEVQHVIAFFKNPAQRLFRFLHVRQRCGDDLAFAHHGVKLPKVGLLSLQIAAVLNSIDHECEGEDFKLERIDHFFGEIACRIGDDLICHGCFLPLAAPCSFTWENVDDLV